MKKESSLLTADLHFTDNPVEEYRWAIFDALIPIIIQYRIDVLYILGDITDRKDRHSAALLNRLVQCLKRLQDETGVVVIILSGNHDAPLTGPYYWSFLNSVGVKYIRTPEIINGIYMLPFSPDPVTDWSPLDLASASVLFMHQTVEGAWVDGNRKIESAPHPMPILPRGVPVFSGDVHRPQKCGNITYIGAPYPVRFSEDWKCRMIFIKDGDYTKPQDIYLPTIRRGILEIKHSSELKNVPYKAGDQCRIRYILTSTQLTGWPVEEQEIRNWATEKGVYLASVEAILTEDLPQGQAAQAKVEAFELMKPEDVIRQFGVDEKLDQAVVDFGLSLAKECQ